MPSIPQKYRDLFERKSFAAFCTLDPDGSPQVTPVWIDYDPDADRVLVNTAAGRRKDRNVSRDPRVALCVMDPTDPYRYLSVEGVVETRTTDGADDHIDRLAQRYINEDSYPYRDEEDGPRVLYYVRPEHVVPA